MHPARVERLEAQTASPRAALRAVLWQGLALDPDSAARSMVWVGFLAVGVGDETLLEVLPGASPA